MTFKPGQSGNPAGKPKGTKSKNSIKLREQILGALDRLGGMAWLVKLGQQEPVAFVSLLGKVLPSTLAGNEDDGKLGLRVVFERQIVQPDGTRNVETFGEGKTSIPDRDRQQLTEGTDGIFRPVLTGRAAYKENLVNDAIVRQRDGLVSIEPEEGKREYFETREEAEKAFKPKDKRIEEWGPNEKW